MIDSVKEARERGVLHSRPPFKSFTTDSVIWPDGLKEQVDAVIWCTGFKASLDHLASLGVVEQDNSVEVKNGKSVKIPNL